MLICSRACAYGLRALVRLAQEEGKVALKARDIAARESIPYAFLAKVLHQLVRAGLVSSSPGLTGGFRLRRPPSGITLLQVVEAIDGLAQFSQCFTGLAQCNEASQCPMHESWQKVRAEILRYLESTTLAQVVEAWERRREHRVVGRAAASVSGEVMEGFMDRGAVCGGSGQPGSGPMGKSLNAESAEELDQFFDEYPQPLD
ncbi:MAG: RrF2 family transcriptional regulator [Bryobacteraceae bacterium]